MEPASCGKSFNILENEIRDISDDISRRKSKTQKNCSKWYNTETTNQNQNSILTKDGNKYIILQCMLYTSDELTLLNPPFGFRGQQIFELWCNEPINSNLIPFHCSQYNKVTTHKNHVFSNRGIVWKKRYPTESTWTKIIKSQLHVHCAIFANGYLNVHDATSLQYLYSYRHWTDVEHMDTG